MSLQLPYEGVEENFSQLINNREIYDTLSNTLRNGNAVVAGGSVLGFYSDFTPKDIDVFISRQNAEQLTKLYSVLIDNGYVLKTILENIHFPQGNMVTAILSFRKPDGITIDFLLTEEDDVIDSVRKFGLNFTRCYWDGRQTFMVDEDALESFLNKSGELSSEYTDYLLQTMDKNIILLLNKYNDRGFNIKYERKSFEILEYNPEFLSPDYWLRTDIQVLTKTLKTIILKIHGYTNIFTEFFLKNNGNVEDAIFDCLRVMSDRQKKKILNQSFQEVGFSQNFVNFFPVDLQKFIPSNFIITEDNDLLTVGEPTALENKFLDNVPEECFDFIVGEEKILNYIQEAENGVSIVSGNPENYKATCFEKSSLESMLKDAKFSYLFYPCMYENNMSSANKNKTYFKLTLITGTVYIPVEDMMTLLENEEELYYFQYTSEVKHSINVGVYNNRESMVSAYHCQEGSNLSVGKLFVVRKY